MRFAPVLEAVSVDGLTAHIVRLDPQHFNFSDIIERLEAKPKKDAPARFSVNNIEFRDGAVEFDDRVTGGRHAVSEVRIGIPFLSNLPVDAEITVQPALAGRIDGTPFDLTGETRPFHESHESSIAIRLDGLDIPKYLAFSPVRLGFEVPAGKLNTDLRVAFRQAVAAHCRPSGTAGADAGFREVRGRRLRAVGARRCGSGSAGGMEVDVVSIEEFEPLQRRLVLADVLADEASITVARDHGGIDQLAALRREAGA